MKFIDKLQQKIPTLSYELFPPKNPAGWGTLYATLAEISKQNPDYISVTYGAGGSTRQKTVDLVARIQSELAIESMAHLTCVGHSKADIDSILETLKQNGIHNVLALRGDPPRGDKNFQAHPDGFAHATDLIGFVKQKSGFNIGCAFYPEKHLEATSLASDIQYLKMKQDAGAQVAISQLFFDNESFYRFRDSATKAGITLPFVAGIMPVVDLAQLPRFQELSGCSIPDSLRSFLGQGSSEEIVQRGIQFATQQCEDLLKNGISGIHLYSLNRSLSSVHISMQLREKGYFPLPVKIV